MTEPNAPPADDYDNPWKDVLEHAFPEFMAYYFPAAHSQIDWARGHEFKNTELRQVVRDAELGKRYADALVQVTLNGGELLWVYIHIEVQGRRDPDFAQRMFTYNYRLYDRYATPIASLAVLADDEDGWKPDRFGFEVLGCLHHLRFPVVKLNELAAKQTTSKPSPTPSPSSPPPTNAPDRPGTTIKPATRPSAPSCGCSIGTAGPANTSSTSSPYSTG